VAIPHDGQNATGNFIVSAFSTRRDGRSNHLAGAGNCDLRQTCLLFWTAGDAIAYLASCQSAQPTSGAYHQAVIATLGAHPDY
jgi:hypothetical protein